MITMPYISFISGKATVSKGVRMLKIRLVGIDTYQDNVAFLSRNCCLYPPEGFRALKKIDILSDQASLRANLFIVDDKNIVEPDELGLSPQAFRRLGLKEGAEVKIEPASPVLSLDYVRDKMRGKTLEPKQIDEIITDIAAHHYSEMEIAAFLVSSAGFMTTAEVLSLTKSMANAGNILHWKNPIMVDKHCIGGIPGNRVSMIIVPIIAAYGLPIPKTSSRAITSPAGTADTMEVLAKVDLTVQQMQNVIEECNGCIVWGGHVNLSPADDILIAVERPLSIDTTEQMVASILSKKLAAGSTHLLIDIPVGPSAKIRDNNEALRLRKLFEYIGDQIGLHVDVITTDGSQPIGNGIGPVLEARDVMAVLRGDQSAPNDLREKSLQLAGMLLEQDPKLRGGSGYAKAEQILSSGEALRTMNRIIDAQGRQEKTFTTSDLTYDVCSQSSGIVKEIDCFRMARIARLAGAPMDKGAGIDLFHKVGEKVKKGEPLYRIHARSESEYGFAVNFSGENNGFVIANGI